MTAQVGLAVEGCFGGVMVVVGAGAMQPQADHPEGSLPATELPLACTRGKSKDSSPLW